MIFKNLFKFLFLLSLITHIYSKKIFIKKKSIISFFYYNYYNESISISINNNKYRESSLLPFNNGVFSINLKKGIYDISTYPYNVNYNYIIDNGFLLNVLLSKEESLVLDLKLLVLFN